MVVVLFVYATVTACPAVTADPSVNVTVPGLVPRYLVLSIAVGVTVDPPTDTVKSPIVAIPDEMTPFMVTTRLVGAVAATVADSITSVVKTVAETAAWVAMAPPVLARFWPAVPLLVYETVTAWPAVTAADNANVRSLGS